MHESMKRARVTVSAAWYLVEAHRVDVVEEMREELDGERGVDAAAAQQHHGGGQRLQRGRRGLRGVRAAGLRQLGQRARQLLLEARHQVAKM